MQTITEEKCVFFLILFSSDKRIFFLETESSQIFVKWICQRKKM